MRPGLSLVELEDRTEHLAAACGAREARLQRSRRWAALIRVDIVRRDPLTTPKPIRSPLLRGPVRFPGQRRPAQHAEQPAAVTAASNSSGSAGVVDRNGWTVERLGRGRIRVRDPRFDHFRARATTSATPVPVPVAGRSWQPRLIANREDVTNHASPQQAG